jgi:hypothetical protein
LQDRAGQVARATRLAASWRWLEILEEPNVDILENIHDLSSAPCGRGSVEGILAIDPDQGATVTITQQIFPQSGNMFRLRSGDLRK